MDPKPAPSKAPSGCIHQRVQISRLLRSKVTVMMINLVSHWTLIVPLWLHPCTMLTCVQNTAQPFRIECEVYNTARGSWFALTLLSSDTWAAVVDKATENILQAFTYSIVSPMRSQLHFCLISPPNKPFTICGTNTCNLLQFPIPLYY